MIIARKFRSVAEGNCFYSTFPNGIPVEMNHAVRKDPDGNALSVLYSLKDKVYLRQEYFQKKIY